MSLQKSIEDLNSIANGYTGFIDKLLEAGWERFGTTKEKFTSYPYTTYGAQRFFMKDGDLHLVSATLNIRDSYGLPNIINMAEYNLNTKENTHFESVTLETLTTEQTDVFIKKYELVDAVSVSVDDDEDNLSYFMGYTSDGRVRFENRSDEARLLPVNETQYLVPIIDCQYRANPIS